MSGTRWHKTALDGTRRHIDPDLTEAEPQFLEGLFTRTAPAYDADMRATRITVLVVVLATLPLAAACASNGPPSAVVNPHWTMQRSRPPDMLGIAFVNDSDGWLTSKAGLILHTSDGGAHWVAQHSGTKAPLGDVTFVDAKHGWAASAWGSDVILRTSDGGLRWKAVTLKTASGFVLAFVNTTTGWAAGGGGHIIHTQDGGRSWVAQHSGTKIDFCGIAFANAMNGWAVGAPGVILATTDGGAHWKRQSSGTTVTLQGVSFVNATHGWISGDHGVILSTKDGGLHWRRERSASKDFLLDIRFTDLLHGWATGGHSGVLRTSDGGRTWTSEQWSAQMDLANRLAFPNDRQGWLIGTGGTVAHWRS